MPIYVLEPPAQYVHRYPGPVIERVLPLSEARKVCAGEGAPADACAWVSHGACHLVIPRNGPVRDRAAYRRHERRIAMAGTTPIRLPTIGRRRIGEKAAMGCKNHQIEAQAR